MIKNYKVVYKGLTVIDKIQSVGRNDSECQDRLFNYVDTIHFDSKLTTKDKEQIELYDITNDDGSCQRCRHSPAIEDELCKGCIDYLNSGSREF